MTLNEIYLIYVCGILKISRDLDAAFVGVTQAPWEDFSKHVTPELMMLVLIWNLNFSFFTYKQPKQSTNPQCTLF